MHLHAYACVCCTQTQIHAYAYVGTQMQFADACVRPHTKRNFVCMRVNACMHDCVICVGVRASKHLSLFIVCVCVHIHVHTLVHTQTQAQTLAVSEASAGKRVHLCV